MKTSFSINSKGRLVRLAALAVLLLAVILAQTIPGWGDAYARHVYPVVGELLSDLSGPVPFAVGDLFIALSLVGVVAWPFYLRFHRKKKWRTGLLGSAEYLAWVYVWFYLAWGLNYAQSPPPNIPKPASATLPAATWSN